MRDACLFELMTSLKVSEILGTLLLGESALSFVADVRDRLLEPDATIIPAAGPSARTPKEKKIDEKRRRREEKEGVEREKE